MQQNQRTETFSFQFYVDMGSNKIGHILINQDSDPYIEASKFCARYELDSIIITILGDSIRDQMAHERAEERKKDAKAKHQQMQGNLKLSQSEYLQRISTVPHDTIQTQAEEKNGFLPTESFTYLASQTSGQFSREVLLGDCKDFSNPRRTSSKIYMNELKEEKFDIFQNLYDNHKQIELKKEISRRKSYEAIPFKPQINKISNLIVEDKRSLRKISNEYILSETLNEFNQQLVQYSQVKSKGKKSIKYSVTSAKKNQDKENTIKILPHSKDIVERGRRQNFREIFQELVGQRKTLQFHDLNCAKLTQKQKLMIPIFQELQRLNLSISKEEFIEAGMQLLKYLPNQQKSLLLRGSLSRSVSKNRLKACQSVGKLRMNKNSRKLMESKEIYSQIPIYNRGQIYLRKSRQKRKKIQDDLDRRLLAHCSFKPKINAKIIS